LSKPSSKSLVISEVIESTLSLIFLALHADRRSVSDVMKRSVVFICFLGEIFFEIIAKVIKRFCYNTLMQIREISLKELDSVYGVVKELYTELSYEAFEDRIYDMRHMEYKMIGIFEREKLLNYAGVTIETSLEHGRVLSIYDFVTKKEFQKQGYGHMMCEYLQDYAKMAACEKLLLRSSRSSMDEMCIQEGFEKKSSLYCKNILV